MSTLITSNISDGTTSVGTEYVVNGSAKAWVNFNGTGTIATRDSFNVASLTDNGAGDYTVNYTSSFLSVGYSFAGMSSASAFAGAYPLSATSLSELADPTAGATRINSGVTGSTIYAGSAKDSTVVGCSFTGDLA